MLTVPADAAKIWPLSVTRNVTVSHSLLAMRTKSVQKKVLAGSWVSLPGAEDLIPEELGAGSHSWGARSTVELQFMIQPLALQILQMCLISLSKRNTTPLQCTCRALKTI